MKTVIFIVAILAFASPVFTGAGDAITCTVTTNNCNMCIADANGAATTACFDCKAGYVLGNVGAATGTCTRCASGLGIAAGTATTGAAVGTRPAAGTCTACDATCGECLLPASAASCTRCAVGKFAPTAPANGVATCSSSCAAGKTRDVATADITAAEVETTVCVNCNAACAECMGTAATKCTKCAAGHYATAFAAPLATCTACASGKGRAAPAAAPAAVEAATVCDVTCAAGIANCKGTAATDALWCLADYWYASNACTKCDSGKTKAAGTATPTAAETAASCTGSAGAAGSSATLIQALCGASVAAYALF